MEVTKEELDTFVHCLLEEEYDRRCEENSVLKELREIHKESEQ